MRIMEVYFIRTLVFILFLAFLPFYLTFQLIGYIINKGAKFIARRISEDDE